MLLDVFKINHFKINHPSVGRQGGIVFVGREQCCFWLGSSIATKHIAIAPPLLLLVRQAPPTNRENSRVV